MRLSPGLSAKSLGWLLLLGILMGTGIFPAPAALTLNGTLFPQWTADGGSQCTVVPGNWAEESTTVKIPVRLIGNVDASLTSLKLRLEVDNASAPLTVSLTTRTNSTARPLPRQTPAPATTPAPTPVLLEAQISTSGGTTSWWCEFYVTVAKPNGEAAAELAKGVVLRVQMDGAPSPHDNVLKLVLGEVWLLAGSPNLSVGLPGSSAGAVIAAGRHTHQTLPFSVAALPATVTGAKPLTTGAVPDEVPAFAANLANALIHGWSQPPARVARPVCIYNWSRGRRMLTQWLEGNEPEAWQGLFHHSTEGYILPGMHGVIWWQGEWEVEQRVTLGADHYQLELESFRQRYVTQSVALREAVMLRLARMVDTGDPTEEDKALAKQLCWVVLQAPGAGRKPEFWDVLYPRDLPQPLSAWGALRAAQFDTVARLRTAHWSGRPSALLVPLEDGAPGWIWRTPADALPRFQRAAERVAQAICHTRTFAETPPASAADFPDGWPRLAATAVEFPGVKKIAAPAAGAPGPGVRPPLLEALVNGRWQPQPIPAAEKTWPVPAEATEVRFGWGDANTALPTLVFPDSPPAQGVQRALPAFSLRRPTPPTPTPGTP